jgi:hypothetical protein
MNRAIRDKLHLIAHGTRPPSDGEWAAYLGAVQTQGPGLVELIVTAGAGPTWSQRKALRTVLAGRRVPRAILTDHKFMTFKLGLASIFQGAREVRAFPTLALPDALAFLGVLASREPVIKDEIAILRREERIGDRYAELLADYPEATHCDGCPTAGVGACTCDCDGCTIAVALLLKARRELRARE